MSLTDACLYLLIGFLTTATINQLVKLVRVKKRTEEEEEDDLRLSWRDQLLDEYQRDSFNILFSDTVNAFNSIKYNLDSAAKVSGILDIGISISKLEHLPFTDLANKFTIEEVKDWRNDYDIIKKVGGIYILASMLETFAFQTFNSNLSTTDKIKLSNELMCRLGNYQKDSVKYQLMVTLIVALDYDDMLCDYDYNAGLYINHNCMMWGCKKVLEMIKSDKYFTNTPHKSKTRKCLSYKQRKIKKEKRYEQKTRN